jgi:trehalose-6-phosphate synthase
VVGDAAIIVKPDSADGLAAAMKSVLDMDGVEKREMVVKGCKRVGYFRHMEAGIKSALLI